MNFLPLSKQVPALPARGQRPIGYAASGLRKLMLSAQGAVIVAAAAASAAAAAAATATATTAAEALSARQAAELHASNSRAAHSKVIRENDEKVVGLRSLPQVVSLFLPVNSPQRRARPETGIQGQAGKAQEKVAAASAAAVKPERPAAVTRYLSSSSHTSQPSRQFSPRVRTLLALHAQVTQTPPFETLSHVLELILYGQLDWSYDQHPHDSSLCKSPSCPCFTSQHFGPDV